MTKVTICQLHIQHFHAIRDLDYPAASLSPGFNLIYGPNGSGKTTTSRAIEALFWPDLVQKERPSLQASVQIGDTSWEVNLDAGYPNWQSPEGEAARPNLPPAERSRSYRLALHELLAEHDHAFAELIQREAFGGFDLAAAAAALDFEHKLPNSNLGACRALRQAQKQAASIRDGQRHLYQEESGLARLEKEADDALQAGQELRLWQALLAWHEARRQAAEAKNHLDTFDPRLARLNGQEADRFRELLGELRDSNATLARLREQALAAEQNLAAIDLGDRQEATALMDRLSTKTDTLGQLDHSVHDLKGHATATRQKADRLALKRRDPLTEPQLEALDALDLTPVIEWAKKAESCRARELAIEALDTTLTPQTPPAPGQLEKLREGVRDLERWLATPLPAEPATAAAPPPMLYGILAMLGTLPWLLLGWLAHPAWLLGLLPAGWILWLHRPRLTHTAQPTDRRAEWQADFKRLDLPTPALWEEDDVRTRLQHLQQELLECERAAALQEAHRHRVEPERTHLLDLRQDLDNKRAELQEILGLEEPLHELQMVNMMERLTSWRQAEAEAQAAETRLQENRADYAAVLDECRALAAPYLEKQLDTREDVQVLLNKLKRRLEDYDHAHHELSNARQDRKAQQREHDRLVDQRRDLLACLNAEDTEDPGKLDDHLVDLDALCRQREAYTKAVDTQKQARWKLNHTQEAVQELAGDRDEVTQLSTEEVETRLHDAQERAECLEALREQIGGLKAQVNKAKQRHELEGALHEADEAESELSAHRDLAVDRSLGDLLTSHIRERTSQHTSKVLRQAQQLLRQMTQGRYDLRITADSPPSFMAHDNATRQLHQLSTLSSGTRVQVLLAVRLAFIEEQEGGGAALPLQLDELLGTSDDQRAAAVIEAVMTMARRGRQIFYFTAQHDEVEKWLGQLRRAADIPHKTIPVGKAEPVSLPAEPPPRPTVPVPGDCTYHAYGERLGVPDLAPWDPITACHLWYLMDTPEPLYRALSRGITAWGQLKSILDASTGDYLRTYGIDETPTAAERLYARANLLATLLKLWQIGRGKRVDRRVLVDSGAVTDTFIDAVAELAQASHGQAHEIIERLRNQEVARFQRPKTDELETYLAGHGYLTTDTPRTAAELELELEAQASRYIEQGLIDPDTPRRLVWILMQQTGS